MKVVDFENLKNTDREIKDPKDQWVSLRKFLAEDGLGYSFHQTTIQPNQEIHMEYKNHTELVSIIRGSGILKDKKNDNLFSLKPGITYLLNQHDPHILYSGPEGLQMHCIFTPALDGQEVHDEKGSYPLPKSCVSMNRPA